MRYARASFGVLPAAGELRPNERASPSETQLVLLPDAPSYPLGEERERERKRDWRERGGVRWCERGKCTTTITTEMGETGLEAMYVSEIEQELQLSSMLVS